MTMPTCRSALRLALCASLCACALRAAAGAEGALPAPAARETALAAGIRVDPAARTVSFAGVRNLAEGVLEVIVATPKGRLHEALFKADVSPLKLQAVLYTLDLDNGPRLAGQDARRGDLVDIDIEYRDAEGKTVREPVENWIVDTASGKPMVRTGWVFTGSVMRDGAFLAEEEGNICINYSVGSTILDSPDPRSVDDTIHTVNGGRADPPVGTPVTIILTPRPKTP
ncbi:MAG: hypothetical protein JXR77_09910 [Lentisphaeria bacterium]|nr:hypothetical protein [Lentisphaeria bacterium]